MIMVLVLLLKKLIMDKMHSKLREFFVKIDLADAGVQLKQL